VQLEEVHERQTANGINGKHHRTRASAPASRRITGAIGPVANGVRRDAQIVGGLGSAIDRDFARIAAPINVTPHRYGSQVCTLPSLTRVSAAIVGSYIVLI
jgi:hypothetical protein